MTIEDLDAELTRVRAHNARLKTSTIAELEAELEVATSPSVRHFLEGQLAAVRAMPVAATPGAVVTQ